MGLDSTRKNGYVVYTYPRSGLNAFTHTYELQTEVHLRGTHFDDDADGMQIVSIIRDPKSSVASLIAMNAKKGHSQIGDEGYHAMVDLYIREFSDKMRFIDSNAEIVVLYEDFCKDPSAVVKKVADALGDEILHPEAVSTKIFNGGPYSSVPHVSSSRELPDYDEFVQYLTRFDFEQAEKNYEALANKHRLNL
jgi:hypothetical protein